MTTAGVIIWFPRNAEAITTQGYESELYTTKLMRKCELGIMVLLGEEQAKSNDQFGSYCTVGKIANALWF